MKLELRRISNIMCWQWSQLKINSELYFDTLEFGDEHALKTGLYVIKIVENPNNYKKYIVIYDLKDNFQCYFTLNYLRRWQGITMRNFRNDIAIGRKINETTLENLDGSYHQVLNAIEEAIKAGENIKIEVINSIEMQENT